MNNNNIPIFLSSDNNYAPFVATTMASVCYNTKSFIEFYILDSGISSENKEKILQLKKEFNNFSIEFLKLDSDKEFEGMNYDKDYITLSTYNRLLISKLKPSIKKYIYLDVDIIVNDDIEKLYSEPLDNYILGAVEDFNSEQRNRDFIDSKHTYFNAGVLLVNNELWSKNDVTNTLFELEKKYRNSLVFADQDLLNKYFECNYKILDKTYNVIEPTGNNYIIRHYAGYLKPWYIDETIQSDMVKNSNLFWKYAHKTQFLSEIKSFIKPQEEIRQIKLKIIMDKMRTAKFQSNTTIPKQIFYVWGANEPLKPDVEKYIATWKKHLPDYKIIQIDESNKTYFDFEKELRENKWFRTVYERKMWAYVADYVRIKVLFEHGGIYFDTDVKILKNFDKFLKEPAFVGMQSEEYTEPAILGSKPKNPLFQKILEFYNQKIWEEPIYNMPKIFKYFLKDEGINYSNFPEKSKQKIIKLKNITIYPERFFIPYRDNEQFSENCIEDDTHSIHLWNGSWVKPQILYFLDNKHKMSIEEIDKSFNKNKLDIIRTYTIKKNLNKIKFTQNT